MTSKKPNFCDYFRHFALMLLLEKRQCMLKLILVFMRVIFKYQSSLKSNRLKKYKLAKWHV